MQVRSLSGVPYNARLVELVDALDLGSSALGREGSSPSFRTKFGRLLDAGCWLSQKLWDPSGSIPVPSIIYGVDGSLPSRIKEPTQQGDADLQRSARGCEGVQVRWPTPPNNAEVPKRPTGRHS